MDCGWKNGIDFKFLLESSYAKNKIRVLVHMICTEKDSFFFGKKYTERLE